MAEDSLEWTTLGSETVYSCPGFDIQRDHVELPSGTRTDFDYLTESESVVILPFTPEETVIVIEEWRQAVSRLNRGLPAGNVESSDPDLETAAARELREETGYEPTTLEPLVTVEPANGNTDTVHHHFVAYDCHPSAEQDLDANETIRVTTSPYADLLEDAVAGQLRDGRAALALLYYDARSQKA